MQRAGMPAVGDADFAHAALENDVLSNREHVMPRLQHFADSQCRNDIARLRPDVRMRRAAGGHADERIHGEPARAAEYPAVGEPGHLALHYIEVPGCRRCPPDPDLEIAHGSPLWSLL